MCRLFVGIAVAMALNTMLCAQTFSEEDFRIRGYVDIHSFDTTIRLALIYSTTDNFVGEDMYGDFDKAYFEKGFAERIRQAQRLLRKEYPDYSLLIYDASRPISIQRRMYTLVKGTSKAVYVANGNRGGKHNYGVAVDLTIVDRDGKPLDMGTPVDHFGRAAHVGQEERLATDGLISREAVRNRRLLRRIMKSVGLVPYRREWWHYELPESMSHTRSHYRLLDF